MLHEPPSGSAARLFRGTPVLRWTLDRLARCRRLSSTAILCWGDQADAVRAVAGDDARVVIKGPRNVPASLEAVVAARRWSDGWRGGLLGTCAFDAGFFGPWAHEAAAGANAVVLIDPAAGLIDPALIDGLIDHAVAHGDQELCFLPAAPGLGSALLRMPLLSRLGTGSGLGNHPGRLLHYYPSQVSREMLAGEACAPVPTPVARTIHSFALSSQRQIRRLQAATADLNGELIATGAEELVERVSQYEGSAVGRALPAAFRGETEMAGSARPTREADETTPLAARQRPRGSLLRDTPRGHCPEAASVSLEVFEEWTGTHLLPREVVLELNTRRASNPIYWPGRYRAIDRPAMTRDVAARIIEEVSQLDDTRLTLGGIGDPLLADGVLEIISAACSSGLAVHLETDLLGIGADLVREIARSQLDVVSVHIPALTIQTYQAVMGVDGCREALGNIETFVRERSARNRAVPLLAPLFVKCTANLGEMEAWYDQWLRAAGSAVIVGPSSFDGLVPDGIAVADMAPPRRRPCARLASRMTILSDGRIVSCEQDVLGRQALGRVGEGRLADVWREQFGMLRASHARGAWSDRPVCAGCREWNRA